VILVAFSTHCCSFAIKKSQKIQNIASTDPITLKTHTSTSAGCTVEAIFYRLLPFLLIRPGNASMSKSLIQCEIITYQVENE
jgi:hypothetical protein